MKIIWTIMTLALMISLAACAGMNSEPVPEERRDTLYTCGCGPQCSCETVSTRPGKCSCGEPLKWGHIVKVEDTEAIVCECAEGCGCAGLNPDDPEKCLSGSPARRVNLKGTGVHFCNCGGTCTCNTVSDTYGRCGKCGMKLKIIEKND